MLKRVAQFSAWQAVGQALSAATIFILGILLPANPLATFGYALSISSLLSTFVTLRLEQAVLVAHSEEDASRLAWAAFTVATIVCVLVAVGAALWFGPTRGLPFISGALSALSISTVGVSQQVLIRHGRSNEAGRMAALRAGLLAVLVVGSALIGSRAIPKAALMGMAWGSVIVTATCFIELRRTAALHSSQSEYKAALRSYKDVWTAYLGQSILSGISLNAPYVAFFHAVDHGLVAGYLLADRVARTPVALLSTSVRSHLTHNYVIILREQRFKEGRSIMGRWSLALAALGFVGLSLIGLAIHLIASHYHSAKWASAAAAVSVLTLWASSVLSNSPAAASLTAWRKNAYILRAQAVELTGRLLVIAALIRVAPHHFYLSLFCIHVPGVLYNFALYRRAARAWQSADA